MDYCHFLIKELDEEFQGQFSFLEKNIEKSITFLVPIKKMQWKVKKPNFSIRRNFFYSFYSYKSFLLLQKAVYMDIWIILKNSMTLYHLKKKTDLEDIANGDYTHLKKFVEI